MREREAPPHSREPLQRAAEPPRKHRRWLRIALVLAAALVALVAFAPQILSTGFVKSFLFARIGAHVGMRISAEELRLAWFGSQEVHGLKVESADGERLASVRLIRLDQGLFDLATGWPKLGPIRIEDGEATAKLLGAVTAVPAKEAAEAPAPQAARLEAAAPVLPESIRIRNLALRTDAGTLRLLEADFVAGATKDAFEARLEIASGEATGAASLEAEIEGLSHDWRGGDALGVTVRARCENFSLAPLWDAVPRAGDGLSLAGTVSGTATVRREREGKLTVSTQWDGRDLSAAGDLLRGDRPALGKVRLVFDGDFAGRTLTVRNFAFDSPVVLVKGRGVFDLHLLDPSFGEVIALPVTGQGTASLEVALAPLTQMLRHTLRLHEDLVVQSGNLSASLEAKADEATLALRLATAVTNLQGMRAGRPVALAPFTLSTDLERSKEGVAAKDIRLAAGFGSVRGKGRIEDFTLDASLDLAKATEDLGQFVDLAGRGASGSVRLHLETRGTFDQGVDLAASADAADLSVALGDGRQWAEPRITFAAAAHADFDAERRLAALAVKNLSLAASAGTVEASGTAARKDQAWTVAGDAKGAGDVGILARQVAAYMGRPATAIAGQWRLEAQGQATPGKSCNLSLTGGATGLAIPIQTEDAAKTEGQATKTLTLQDASLSAEVTYESAKERLVTVRSLRIEAPGLRAGADGSATLPGQDETGRLRVNGEGDAEADLAVLARTLQPFGLLAPGSRMAGKVVLRGKAASDDKGTAGEGNLEATDLDLYFAETETAIREPRASARVAVGYAPEAKRWTIDTQELTSALAKGRATAVLTPADASLGVEAQADLALDGARLRALLGNRLPADLALGGGWRAVAAVRGPMADEAPTWNRKIAGLAGEGRIEIGSATFRGLKATGGTIPWNLAAGKLVLSPNADDPARVTVNEGTVTPAGSIDLAPDEPRYVLAGPAQLAKDVHLTGEMAEEMLSYLSPLVGQSISPTGRLSLTAEKADIPLGASVRQAATFLGDFTIEDFESRLKGPLAILAAWTGAQGEVEKQTLGPFPIRLENGLFHLEDQKVRLRRGIEFRLDGTIALDGTMETTVGIPLTEDLLKKAGVPVRPGGARIDRLVRIPLKGTVKHPKLDEARIPIEILKTVGDLFLGGEKGIEEIGNLLKDVLKKPDAKEPPPPGPAPDNPPPADGQTKPPPEEPTLKNLIDLFKKPKKQEPAPTP
jgi:hypothetical protein